MNIIEAMEHPDIWGTIFAGDTWSHWKIFLKALFGIPMAGSELLKYTQFTNRNLAPSSTIREAYAICGMGGGKSYIASTVAAYLACFRDYSEHLKPGAWATVMLLAGDQSQADEDLSYVHGLIADVPMLSQLIEKEVKRTIYLTNRVKIEVKAANFRRVRGRSLVAVLADELAFWESDGANPDTEILRAVRPGLGRIPGSLLLAISSPYAKQGALFQAHEKHFGNDESKKLVWQADTLSMYPNYDQSVINESYEEDPTAAQSDFGGIFREDLESYVSYEIVKACIPDGMPEGYEHEFNPAAEYHAFVDSAGGTSEGGLGDSFTVAIAHQEGGRLILDAYREKRPPFNPEIVAEEFSAFLKSYGIRQAKADAWARGHTIADFAKHGITITKSERDRSSIYLDLLPYLNSGKVQLLNSKRLLNQFTSLQRRTGTAGKDSIDHPKKRKSHDDCANVVAGALLQACEGVDITSLSRSFSEADSDLTYRRRRPFAAEAIGARKNWRSFDMRGGLSPDEKLDSVRSQLMDDDDDFEESESSFTKMCNEVLESREKETQRRDGK